MSSISINSLREKIRKIHPRTRKAQLNTLFGLFVKGGGMIISLMLLPLTIDYLSKETYGTWLTISSIVTMLTFLDIGIGNGLRNKFSEAVSRNDVKLARSYVSTAYVIFGGVQLSIIILFSILEKFIPWQQVFNSSIAIDQLRTVVWLTVTAIAIKLVLDILSYILLALQEPGVVGLTLFLSNLLILIGTYLLSNFTESNLIYIALVTAFSPIIIMTISGLILYNSRLRMYRPTIKLADFKYGRSLLSLGSKFFLIQIAVVILFYTDNLIITQLFGPAEVTTYNVVFRYFNAVNILFSIVLTPYWSAFTEASVKNDVKWMKETYLYLQRLWLGLFVAVVFMIVVAKPVFSVWIGNRVEVPDTLNIVMGLSVLIISWNNITVSVINGLGKIKLQLFSSVFAALINIPMSIYLCKVLNLGSSSIIIATCISLLPASILGTIQAKKLSNGQAYGIWAK